MNKYEQALLSFTPIEQSEIQTVLDKWEKDVFGSYLVTNIKNENNLELSSMKKLLWKLYRCKDKKTPELEKEYKLECYRHTLKGREISFTAPLKKPKILGRAISKSNFVTFLKNNYYTDPLKKPKKSQIDKLLNSLVLGNPPSIRSENSIKIASHGAWVTWSKNKNNNDPFFFAKSPKRVYKVCASLGLDDRQTRQAHFLLRYNYDNIKLHFPTIADAGLFPYFYHPPEDELHGLTRPYQPQRVLSDGLKTFKRWLKRRPEAVHSPTKTISDLNLPLELLAG
ncbi:hypothetical protein [uncultured Desulfosarcina sp.]|uniref:hypothetical protein n=1 Tax=uncultured Desulfosarcina sp. TaxID=218289 RepID=UPI0029C748E0|nr:hypothetical protein [uncultured Desulfosarcina sp.]